MTKRHPAPPDSTLFSESDQAALDKSVVVAKLRVFNERSRFGAETAFFGIALLGWVLYLAVGWQRTVPWVVVMVGIEVVILWVAHRCQRDLDNHLDATQWLLWHFGLVAAVGAGWGAGVWVASMSDRLELYLATLTVLVGVGGVSMITMAFYRTAALLYFGMLYTVPIANALLYPNRVSQLAALGLSVGLLAQLGYSRELGKIVVRDVRQAARNTALILKLNDLLIHDQLTGAFSRRYTLERLEQMLAVRGRLVTPASIAMFDIDHFKQINDRCGHAAGDRALCEVVRVVEREVRAGDILGRIGGEEFLLLMPQTDLRAAQTLSERLRRALQEACIEADGDPITITASFGVAEIGVRENQTPLLARLDNALYAAKQGGRNRVALAEPAHE